MYNDRTDLKIWILRFGSVWPFMLYYSVTTTHAECPAMLKAQYRRVFVAMVYHGIFLNIPACFKVCVHNTIYRKTGVLHKMPVKDYLTEYHVGREERGEERVVIGQQIECLQEKLI